MNNNRIIYNKLIRDKIPEILDKNNINYKYHIVKNYPDICKAFLLNKLTEECNEIIEAANELNNNTNSKDKLIEEIADLLTVIEAIQNIYNIGETELKSKKLNKDNTRGKFDKFIILDYTEK